MDLKTRRSGVLLPISSLPGTVGTGALGGQARQFADFLAKSGQTWWQMLPVNPIDSFHSPYSTCSAFAGEPLYIDLEELLTQDLLSPEDLEGVWEGENTTNTRRDRADYSQAYKIREKCWRKAFERFRYDQGGAKYRQALYQFRRKNAYWLDNFTRFMAFTGLFETSNWREWPEPFRSWNTLPSPGTPDFNITQYPKQTDACGYPETFWRQVDDIREYNEFLQLVFDVQWWDFKGYCHEKGIALLGDVPIYVGMASADTWSHPELFQITVEGRMNRVAGVPPDAFNPDGQRWDAPLYDWPEHERTEFNWWIHRIGQAMKRFDALRLDHFIGFYNYYSFPGELANKVFPFELPEIDAPCFVEDISDSVENVIEDLSGEIEMVRYELGWTPGPQKKLFNALFEHFPREKFLAEDLGVLNAGVHRLREHYSLPGMKVLQFEFDHRGRIDPTELWEENSVACTGTHDTPTVIDWLDHLEKTGPYHWDPSNFAHVWHVLLKYQKNEEKVAIDFDAHPDDFLPAYDFWRYSVIRTEEAEENDFERGIPLNDFQVRADVIALRYAALRAVMQSKSYVALFPMQDILGLGASARMNFPGKVNGNWNWRLDPTLLTDELVTFLRQLTLEGDRIGFCPVMS